MQGPESSEALGLRHLELRSVHQGDRLWEWVFHSCAMVWVRRWGYGYNLSRHWCHMCHVFMLQDTEGASDNCQPTISSQGACMLPLDVRLHLRQKEKSLEARHQGLRRQASRRSPGFDLLGTLASATSIAHNISFLT